MESTISYWVKQLIAREVDLETVRRSYPKSLKENTKPTNSSSTNIESNTEIPETKQAETVKSKMTPTRPQAPPATTSSSNQQTSPTNLPNHLRTLKPKTFNKNQKESVSYILLESMEFTRMFTFFFCFKII